MELFPLPPALVVGSEACPSQATPLCCSSKSPNVNSGAPLELTSPPAAPYTTLPKQLWRNTTKTHRQCPKKFIAALSVQALGLPHGALDVQGTHVLPVLLQQGHQEVDGQVDVVDEFVLRHLHVTHGHGQTEHLGTAQRGHAHAEAHSKNPRP